MDTILGCLLHQRPTYRLCYAALTSFFSLGRSMQVLHIIDLRAIGIWMRAIIGLTAPLKAKSRHLRVLSMQPFLVSASPSSSQGQWASARRCRKSIMQVLGINHAVHDPPLSSSIMRIIIQRGVRLPQHTSEINRSTRLSSRHVQLFLLPLIPAANLVLFVPNTDNRSKLMTYFRHINVSFIQNPNGRTRHKQDPYGLTRTQNLATIKSGTTLLQCNSYIGFLFADSYHSLDTTFESDMPCAWA
ncbi:hypothetical protein V8F06_001441 [Rhypophila decipiens]